jgi:hypothetical protein
MAAVMGFTAIIFLAPLVAAVAAVAVREPVVALVPIMEEARPQPIGGVLQFQIILVVVVVAD